MSSLHSGFHVPDSALWILNSHAWHPDSRSTEIPERKFLDPGFIMIGFWITPSGFRVLSNWIPHSKANKNLDFELPYMGR